MISVAQYFLDKNPPMQHMANAVELLRHVNALLECAATDDCYENEIDPDTGTQISGAKGGSGDGGYRAADSKTGAPKSNHKTGQAVDVCDTKRLLAQWCVDHQEDLDRHGLYCEDFRWSPVWVHLQSVAPASKKRIYIPSTKPPLAPALVGQKPLPLVVK